MKYTSDATLGVSLLPEIPKPLDARLVVDSVEELYKIPKSIAYLGMPVIHAGSGAIYILTDKELIDLEKGWTASYETVQIKMCTEEQYKDWLANTENNKSIDGTLNYIREGVYYYITEDSINDKYQFYVSYGQFETLENTVRLKASSDSVMAIATSVSTLKKAVEEYENIKEDYLSKYDLDEGGRLDLILANYYLKSDSDAIFVKKSDITGDAEDSGFIFVNKNDYNAKIEEIENQLLSTLKTDSDGSLNSISVNTIKNKEGGNTLNMNDLSFNGKGIALKELLPNILVLTLSQYDEMRQAGTLDTSKYYMTYVGDSKEDEASGYMTRDYFEKFYIKKDDAQAMFDFLKTIQSGDMTLASIVTSLSNKIDRSEVYNKQEANDTFQIKGEYISLHQDISGKADKKDIPTRVGLLENDANYISLHQSLEGYAKITDIPDVSLFLKEHLDISNLASKGSIPKNTSDLNNDSNFVTLKQVTDYLKDNLVIYSDKIIDSLSPNQTLNLFNAYVKDTYVTKSTYNELKASYDKLVAWAKLKGYEEL